MIEIVRDDKCMNLTRPETLKGLKMVQTKLRTYSLWLSRHTELAHCLSRLLPQIESYVLPRNENHISTAIYFISESSNSYLKSFVQCSGVRLAKILLKFPSDFVTSYNEENPVAQSEFCTSCCFSRKRMTEIDENLKESVLY